MLLNFLFDEPDKVTDYGGHGMDLERIKRDIGVYSSGEQVMLRLAMDIWGQYGKVEIFDICRRLDNGNFRAAMKALIEFRKL